MLSEQIAYKMDQDTLALGVDYVHDILATLRKLSEPKSTQRKRTPKYFSAKDVAEEMKKGSFGLSGHDETVEIVLEGYVVRGAVDRRRMRKNNKIIIGYRAEDLI